MPNNFFSVDSRFPNIENKTQEQINGEVINYLFLLLEQLRYTLGNLGVGNFNEAELDGIAGMISDPIYVRLEDAEGNVNAVQITAEGLTQRVSDAEGNIDALTITSNGLANRVSDAEGNVSALTQTAEGLSTRVSNNEGDISTLTQTADGLSVRVSNNEGSISSLTQTANSISAVVGDHSIAINNLGVQMQGKVSFTNLQTAGQTIIDAGNITTGTLNAINITNSNFTSYDATGRAFLIGNGAFTIYNATSMIGGMYINSANEMLVLHSTRGLQLDASVKIASESTINGFLILHMGNIAQNAASIRALLGI